MSSDNKVSADANLDEHIIRANPNGVVQDETSSVPANLDPDKIGMLHRPDEDLNKAELPTSKSIAEKAERKREEKKLAEQAESARAAAERVKNSVKKRPSDDDTVSIELSWKGVKIGDGKDAAVDRDKEKRVTQEEEDKKREIKKSEDEKETLVAFSVTDHE